MEIFFVGDGSANTDLPPDRVGSKASNLARLARIGLRVPPAFVLGTDVCRELGRTNGQLPGTVRSAVREAIGRLELVTRRRFGGRAPLLVSVRSSPPTSMPGMLDTVLNVGVTEAAIRGLLRTTGNPVARMGHDPSIRAGLRRDGRRGLAGAIHAHQRGHAGRRGRAIDRRAGSAERA